jgi:uncharacterized protein (DUF1778 family)
MVNSEAEKVIEKTHSLNFTKKEADMFLEMTSQTAAKGPDAATLARLHAMALEACEALK